ncbi:MAG TPA: biotin/lipoyl-containing protein [Bryobacteraceae bacterium]|nr:biotin/lipoyl-containing protein [Bryobacteraceae bacterium]
MSTEEETPRAAAAAVGDHASLWARQGRAAIRGSHSLGAPLARWTPDLTEPSAEPTGVPDAGNGPQIAIPVLPIRAQRRTPEDYICRSPITGMVIAVTASAGLPVTRNQSLIVIEAMKMENHVKPAMDGVVKIVHVAAGEAVKAGQVLFELA